MFGGLWRWRWFWFSGTGVTPGVSAFWAMDDGGSLWVMREGPMPAVADPIKAGVGQRRRLFADFGNFKELLTATIVSSTISVGPVGHGVTIDTKTDHGYYVSAWFTCANAGEWVVTVTVTLSDGSVIPRKALLVVE